METTMDNIVQQEALMDAMQTKELIVEEDAFSRPELTVPEASEYEGKAFSEPTAGFSSLLSRWNQRDAANQDVVRLPGLKKADGTKKTKTTDGTRKHKTGDGTKKTKKVDADSKLKKGDSARKLKKEDSARKLKNKKHEKKEEKSTKTEKNSDMVSGPVCDDEGNSVEVPVLSDEKGQPEEDESETTPSADQEDIERSAPPRRRSRSDLKEMFEKQNPSHATKKKALRQPANVYQAAHEFTKDFKPPKFPKTDEEKDLIKKALRKNFVFADLTSKELRPLIAAFELCSFEADETIIKQGDRGDYFYIIRKGKVIFRVNDVDVGKAGKGSSFGELALLYTCPRAATVVAAKTSKVFRVDQATFQFILQSQTAESAKEKLELLTGVNFLKDLDKQQLKLMTRVMTPKIFSEGDFLVKKGEPGDAFYVIQEGQVTVKDISVGGTTYENLELGPGGYFGERALATSEPRAANVIGKTRGVAFSIDRETFEKALGGMETVVMKAQDARLLAGIPLFHRAHFSDDIFARLADLVIDSCYVKSHVILNAGEKIPAALYVVREGEILVTTEGQPDKIYSVGEFFGVETMLNAAESRSPRVDSPYGVSALTDCCVGVLTLADCRFIFDTDLLAGKKKAPSYTLTKEELKDVLPPSPKANIIFDDLKKETILGAGSFGQVWLVRGTDEDTGETKPYALKIQSKYGLYEEGQITAVIREKQLLAELNHPFIVNLQATYHDPTFVYFLTEFVQGGELFSVIHKEEGSGMKEDEAKFYAFGIADAFSHLHSMNIVYRDMKPENVLIDATGYPKLIDFGFAKYCPEKTFTFCGTPGYVCPEIVTKRGHDCTADNWSLGVLVYEMLSGENPFYFEGMDQITLFRSIVEDDFLPLTSVSKEASDIVSNLLIKDPSTRLGSSKRCGFVMQHTWFANMDLEAMRRRELTPPWIPQCADPYDPANFDDWGSLVDKSTEYFPPIPEKDEQRFQEEF